MRISTTLLCLAASLAAAPAFAQGKPKKKFEVGELYKPGPLGDHSLGKQNNAAKRSEVFARQAH